MFVLNPVPVIVSSSPQYGYCDEMDAIENPDEFGGGGGGGGLLPPGFVSSVFFLQAKTIKHKITKQYLDMCRFILNDFNYVLQHIINSFVFYKKTY